MTILLCCHSSEKSNPRFGYEVSMMVFGHIDYELIVLSNSHVYDFYETHYFAGRCETTETKGSFFMTNSAKHLCEAHLRIRDTYQLIRIRLFEC